MPGVLHRRGFRNFAFLVLIFAFSNRPSASLSYSLCTTSSGFEFACPGAASAKPGAFRLPLVCLPGFGATPTQSAATPKADDGE